MKRGYTPRDKWSCKAKDEEFRARSVYKLQELDQKFRLLSSGMCVLDIGAAPGSWLQYASSKVGKNGKVIGLDRQDIESVADNVVTKVCDITDAEAVQNILDEMKLHRVDLILSDLAPDTSGIKDVDQWRSVELNQYVLALADMYLKKGGNCVMKVLRGADFDDFLQDVRKKFQTTKTVIAQASRSSSREVYLVALKKLRMQN